jgi:hypothetical protein
MAGDAAAPAGAADPGTPSGYDAVALHPPLARRVQTRAQLPVLLAFS